MEIHATEIERTGIAKGEIPADLSRLVIQMDARRRQKLRKVAALRGMTMREMITAYVDSLPDPPHWK